MFEAVDQLVRRRTLVMLAVVAASGPVGLSGCGDPPATPTVRPKQRIGYGRDDSQYGELFLPAGERRQGTAVIIHGGFWRAAYGAGLGAPLAADLAARGWVAWNLEYRRVGSGGGWPNTLLDVAAGVDHLAELARDASQGAIDLDRVVVIGHSAGGQLAAWLAGRHRLPPAAPGARPRVAVTAAVSQAGVVDLAVAARQRVGGSAVTDLLGGSPESHPDRYRIADPRQLVPIGVPVVCVHSRSDDKVPFTQSEAYVAAGRQSGDPARLREVTGDHFAVIDPASDAWRVVVEELSALFGA